MNPVENYIYKQNAERREVFIFFHELLTHQFQLIPHIKWSVPMYKGKAWVIYLNPDKKSNGVHVCFLRGNELSNKNNILNAKGRKLVSSILVETIDTIPYKLLLECIEEAVELDKNVTFKMKRNQ